jgi:D-aminopeptidase
MRVCICIDREGVAGDVSALQAAAVGAPAGLVPGDDVICQASEKHG